MLTLRFKVNKCRFGETKLSMLGHIVDKNGVHPDPEKERAIQEFPRPIDVKSIQSFIGLCTYYRKFIRNFAEIARPITCLTKISVLFILEPVPGGEEEIEEFNENLVPLYNIQTHQFDLVT